MRKPKSTREKSRRSLLTGSIIAAFLVASPYFFYLYEGFPAIKVWEFSFLGMDIKYDSLYYQDINTLAWILFGKLIPLIFLLIWFFTCKHWWYHAIAIPICMYSFQIYNLFKEDLLAKDNLEIFYLAPLIFFALIFLYTIRTRIFDKIHNIDFSELDRVSLKGEIKEKENDITNSSSNSDDVDDDDDDPLFMG